MVRRLLLVAVTAVLLGACGSGVQVRPEVAGDGRGAVYDSAGVCDALARVAASDRRAGQDAAGLAGWDEVQPVLVAASSDAATLYREAQAVAPAELVEPLEQVAATSEALSELAARSDSRRAFQRDGQRLEGFVEAQAAVVALNDYTRQSCGFTLVDN
ncbi:MAG: hypothetical protein JNK12_09965 [Acidimicrobiales bacterium]|nr:hypothetical protein [Acidimicrobiales bacterium]